MEQIKKGRVKLLRRRPVGRSLEICFLCHRSTLNYTNLQMAFNEEWNGKRSSFCTGILAVIPDPIHTRISTTILPTFCIFIFGKMELEAPYFWSQKKQTPKAVHNFPYLTLKTTVTKTVTASSSTQNHSHVVVNVLLKVDCHHHIQMYKKWMRAPRTNKTVTVTRTMFSDCLDLKSHVFCTSFNYF